MFNIRQVSRKWILVIVLSIGALLSMTLLESILTSPEFYSQTIQTIDSQKQDATVLSVAVTAISTTLTTLPEDMASPIANEIADLSSVLFVIVCVLVLEKFLLTIFGWVVSAILIPMACVLKIVHIVFRTEAVVFWIKKIVILSIALVFIIPMSAKVTSLIEDTFSESIAQTMDAAFQMADESATAEEDDNSFLDFLTGLKDNVVALVDTAKNMLNILIDAVAVLAITSCAIPLITALVFVWIFKALLSNLEGPAKNVIQFPMKKELKHAEQEKLVS